jgi:CRISPR-associated protein Csx17
MRLVAEQADPAATCRWEGDLVVLSSNLHAEALVDFLLHQYRPSPVLVPWNKDAGFKAGASNNTKALLEVESNDDPRFEPFQRAIAATRAVMARPDWADLSKDQQVSLIRNALPDDALDWVDAAVVLRPEGPAYPLILGSGGNLGRLDLSPNFMSRLLVVLDRTDAGVGRSRSWLRHALMGEGAPALRDDSAGQYDPGAAGGVRAGPAGAAAALTNPWDFVLLIEGALLWAAGVARRLGGVTRHASLPFTVEGTTAGYASMAANEAVKGEIWTPVWTAPVGLPGLRRLFAEGRISWSGRQARSGLDAVRALGAYGVDVGLDRFQRHVVADRLGQNPLVVSVGVHPVRPQPGIDLLADLDGWLDRLRLAANDKNAAGSTVQACARVERAVFAAAAAPPGASLAPRMQRVLGEVAATEAAVARSAGGRAALGPVPWLEPERWLPILDDGTPELRIAASLALARDEQVIDPRHGALRFLLTPTTPVPGRRRGRLDPLERLEWSQDPTPIGGLGHRPVEDLLAEVLMLRSRAERRRTEPDQPVGAEPWFPAARDAKASDAEAFAAGLLDLTRIAELLAGLMLLRPDPVGVTHRWLDVPPPSGVSPGWRLLAPFYSRHPIGTMGTEHRLRPLARWASLLAAGRIGPVVAEALTRYRMARLHPTVTSPGALAASTPDTPLVAAALIVSAARADVQRAVEYVTDPTVQQGETP